jgi:hypothetical protein
MADPIPYSRGFSFAGYQTATPQDPLPGQHVDIELDALGGSVSALIEVVTGIRRSDGKLKNGVVSADSVDSGFLAGIRNATTQEAINAAAAAEVSRASAAGSAGAATTSADAAATSAGAAAGSAATSVGSATAAAASATNAANYAALVGAAAFDFNFDTDPNALNDWNT